MKEERPWGNFEVLDESNGYKVKRLEIRLPVMLPG